MIIEILIAESYIEKTAKLQKFFKEYDELIERKRIELEKIKAAAKK